jgi:uncharacterized protein CbrC (UPF0167 family)
MRLFRYFAHPHRSTTYQEQPQPCDICGAVRPGYPGGFSGVMDDVRFVCEECLASGRLAEYDLSTNEGNPAELAAQLRRLQPQLGESTRRVHDFGISAGANS